MESEMNIPEDLRSTKKVGRPSNMERSTDTEINQQMRLLTADLLKDLQKNRSSMSNSEKIQLVGKLLTYVSIADSKSEEDAAFDVLAEKYLKIEMRVKSVGGNTTTKSAGTKPRKKKAGKGTE